MTENLQATSDHLRIALDLASRDFWSVHAALNNEYENSIDQFKDIEELVRLGSIVIRIREARRAF